MVMIASPHRCDLVVGNGASMPTREYWPVGEPRFHQPPRPRQSVKRGPMPDLLAATEKQLCFRRRHYPSTRHFANVRPGQIARTYSIGMTGQGALRPPDVGPLGQAKKRLARRATTRLEHSLIFSYGAAGPPTTCSRNRPANRPEQSNAQLHHNLIITRRPVQDNGYFVLIVWFLQVSQDDEALEGREQIFWQARKSARTRAGES